MTTLSAPEQLILELINRARMDPAAEAARIGIDLNAYIAPGTISTASKQVLAGNNALAGIAESHSVAMNNSGVLATSGDPHNGAGDGTMLSRFQGINYPSGTWAIGENVAWNPGTTDLDALSKIIEAALFKDDPAWNTGTPGGHRLNILNDNFREVGIGEITGSVGGTPATLVTEDFGLHGTQWFLTGAVYNDTVSHDNFYNVGEGVQGVTATVTGASGTVGSDTTGSGGGWSVGMPGGTYTVTFSNGGLAAPVAATVEAGNRNAKADLVNGNEIDANVTTTLGSGAKDLRLLGIDNVNGTGNADDNMMYGNKGNNVLNGAGGTDTAVYSGNMAAYAITNNANGTVTVNGAEGTDTLISIERIKFADQTYQVPGTAVAGSVSINDLSITEGNAGTQVATFTVMRTGGTAAFDVSFATQDGTATTADGDYVAASNTLHFGANENTKTISVTINGDTKVEANETFNVLLSGATNGATISDGQGSGTIINDDVAAVAGSVSINDLSITEGNAGTQVATFTVMRTGGTAAFDVSFATQDGTATTADGDYVAASNTLHFGANENTKTISVTINGDTKVEANETFNVLLSGATNGATISDGQGSGTIINDDVAAVAGSVSINDLSITEGNAGTQVATFTVMRTGGTAAFDVSFATQDGTATTADGDYVAASNTLHFGANENTKTISVTINGDTKVEANETFNVLLSGATNGATISDGQGSGTIINDDVAAVAGSVSINDLSITEGNAGTQVATFTVMRTGGTAAFDVSFATQDGTATTADGDYVAASNTLHFGANENTKTISVTINGDTKVEANETFNVLLSGATNGATISDGQGSGTIVNDDVAVVTKPDLVVDSISAAASVVQGQKLDFSYLVKNLGTAAAGSHYAGVNVDATVDESHYTVWNTVNSLAANGQATFTNSIDTANLSVGQHTLYVKEDYWNNGVDESNESNNVKSISFNVTAPVVTKPDLVVDSISAAASVVQGQKLDFSYLVKNLGTAAAGSHYAGVNVDAAVDESHYTAWNTVNSLAANGQATFTNSIDTANLSVGHHTLYIKEDYWHDGVSESNESNNVKTVAFDVTAPVVTKPDLVVDSISAAASVMQGQKLDFSYLVKNLGTAAADSHYAGVNVDAAVDESHYSAWNTVNSLAANGQATFTNSIDTANLSVGHHTLYIKEDYWHDGVSESNESNNVKTVAFDVTAPVATKPDLVVDSISAPDSVRQGDSFDFSFLVKNLGSATAGLHYAGINVDAAVDESHYSAWNTVNSLAAKGQATFTDSIDTANLSVGQHTLYIKEDYWHNGVSETNESNNVTAITFNVTGNHAPDVTTYDQTLGVNEWAQAYWFIDYIDPDGDDITQFRFWDSGTAANSGYFWTPDNAHQAAGTAITVDAAHLEDVWFRGGQTAGTEQLWVQASDGHNWSQWMSLNVTTELH